MMVDAMLFGDIGRSWLIMGFLVFLRVGGAMALLPAFGEQTVPQRVRLGLTLAFTIIVAPTVDPGGAPGDLHAFLPLLATETAVGLVFGLAIRLMIHLLQITAAMAAQSTSLAQIFGGASVDPLPAFGHILVVAGLALATATGLHIRVAEALIGSYDAFPVGSVLDSAQLASFLTARVSAIFSMAFSFAAPFVVAAFIYNLALGAINRAMPQLMVVMVGAPAITAAGLAMFAILSPLLLQLWLDALDGVLADPFGVGR
ncbi:flagellar biosynthetic protein FliR [Tropicimonas isoalkanivorans]|uniref:Flagellar biosynthetic protein FliR n=1 Tax=Tropicimonas isoalkanivorans TaxID=441112 RepID=A0A1I1L9B3_9RHOB|nr:flagellar biosynthetic protein FliR [Tropicimonas isoalkanivorans]SFC66130.1 flagellar biosynthetic protein FliR [Tropicimonas isoalkanivorans]